MAEENKKNQSQKEKIAAVVVTYNRKDLLKECLDALLNQTRPLDSIILIDNASTDGTPEFLKEKGYLDNPKIHVGVLNNNVKYSSPINGEFNLELNKSINPFFVIL